MRISALHIAPRHSARRSETHIGSQRGNPSEQARPFVVLEDPSLRIVLLVAILALAVAACLLGIHSVSDAPAAAPTAYALDWLTDRAVQLAWTPG